MDSGTALSERSSVSLTLTGHRPTARGVVLGGPLWIGGSYSEGCRLAARKRAPLLHRAWQFRRRKGHARPVHQRHVLEYLEPISPQRPHTCAAFSFSVEQGAVPAGDAAKCSTQNDIFACLNHDK